MIEEYKISKSLLEEFEKPLIDLPWFYMDKSTYYKDSELDEFVNDTTHDTPQMVHSLYKNNSPNSQLFNLYHKAFDDVGIKILSIFRMKLNLNFPSSKQKTHQFIHRDIEREGELIGIHKSMIVYLNDTDGDTIFFDDNLKEIQRVKPEKGKAIVFDSVLNHAAENPIKSDCRIVANYIFVPYEIKKELINYRKQSI